MNRSIRTRFFLLLAALAPGILALQPANVDTQTQGARRPHRRRFK